ncbi:MAG: GTP-binding protein, partial [Blastocatellia bacterium]|nr:GTP-binding protein [Blastocatellia bacterium]
SLQELGIALNQDDDRCIVDLLIEQVEFSDVIIINKIDLVTSQELSKLKAILTKLNPDAKLVEAESCQVPLNKILNTKLFDFDKASRAAGWLKEINGEHIPETEEYGISSFVYRSRRPFHPEKLWKLFHTEDSPTSPWNGVLRSKGFFWLASRMDFIGSWSQAGGACRIEPVGVWWTSTPEFEWPEDEEILAEIRQQWQEPFGDRRQELVFIGIKMNKKALVEALDSCLLTGEEIELGEEEWVNLPDPFGIWTWEMLQETHSHSDQEPDQKFHLLN